MRFTEQQYDAAIQALQDGKQQLEPSGGCCAICGDNDHLAYECGHNPLLAMAMCEQIAKESSQLHETLHLLAGYEIHLGRQLGPARIHLPAEEEPTTKEYVRQ